MLIVNKDTVGEAAIVECDGIIIDRDDALQLRHAVMGETAIRLIVIDLSKVSVTGGKGLSMLSFLQHWARQHGIQLKVFNPRPSVRCDLEHAGSPSEFEFVSLGEVMALLIDAGNRQALVA